MAKKTYSATPSQFQLMILFGMQRMNIYHGTVPEPEILRRRRKNKQARASRRVNRMSL